MELLHEGLVWITGLAEKETSDVLRKNVIHAPLNPAFPSQIRIRGKQAFWEHEYLRVQDLYGRAQD